MVETSETDFKYRIEVPSDHCTNFVQISREQIVLFELAWKVFQDCHLGATHSVDTAAFQPAKWTCMRSTIGNTAVF